MTLADQLYALLFVASAPVRTEELVGPLKIDKEAVEAGLCDLEARLGREGPVRLVRLAGGVQLATHPDLAEVIGAFLKPGATRLGRGMLEVLAIVAYRQPVTIAEIEGVRGASAEYSVRGLLERRLLVEVGRRKAPGRPVEYGTSAQFLHYFGLDKIEDLPPVLGDAGLALPAPEADPVV